jgi:hypothetical protein
MGRKQLGVLGDRVLAQVPRVVGLLRALGRQRQPVRGRHVADFRRLRKPGEQRPRILNVLDRLQKDDRVARAGVGLDEVALEP